MKLAHIFADVPVGSVCTGTVAYYRLPIRKLLKAGVICEREGRETMRTITRKIRGAQGTSVTVTRHVDGSVDVQASAGGLWEPEPASLSMAGARRLARTLLRLTEAPND